MVTAYIFVNLKPGSKSDFSRESFSKIKDIKYLDLVYGAYDLVIKVEVKKLKDLQDIIKKLRKISGVEKTVTMISIK